MLKVKIENIFNDEKMANLSINNLLNSLKLDSKNRKEILIAINNIKKEFINIPKDLFYFDILDNIINKAELDNYIYHINSGTYGMVFRCDSEICIKYIVNPINNQIHEFETPRFLSSILNNSFKKFINNPLLLLKNKNLIYLKNIFYYHVAIILILKTITSHNFNMPSDIYKIKYNLISEIYSNLFGSDNKNINLLYATYLYKKFSKTMNIVYFNKFRILIDFFKNNSQSDFSNGVILVTPMAISAANEFKINNNYEPDMTTGIFAYIMYKNYIRYMIFQILLLLIEINKNELIFLHNDLKPNNILVFYNNEIIKFKYKKYNIVYDMKFIFKLSDFDFSLLKNNKIVNQKLNNKSYLKYDNMLYDIYYLFYNIKYVFFKSVIDVKLLNFITMFLEKYKDQSEKGVYVGDQKMTIEDVENLLFNNDLFTQWYKI